MSKVKTEKSVEESIVPHDFKDRLIIHVYEGINCNPNGDPDDGNHPRYNYETQKAQMSHYSIKRFMRDYLGDDAFYSYDEYDVRKYISGKAVNGALGRLIQANGGEKIDSKDKEAISVFLSKFIDNRVFGYVVDGNKTDGALQVCGALINSLNKCEVKTNGLTCIFPTDTDKGQGTIGKFHTIPFTVFAAPFDYNGKKGKKNGVRVDDIEQFIKLQYIAVDSKKTTSKNFNSVCMIEIIKKQYSDGSFPNIKGIDKLVGIEKTSENDYIYSDDDFKYNFDNIYKLSELDFIENIIIHTDYYNEQLFKNTDKVKIKLIR